MPARRPSLRRDAAFEYLRIQPEAGVITTTDVNRFLAEQGGSAKQAVSGFDLVFTPVKSVSVLWGLADEDTSKTIARIHDEAWQASMTAMQEDACVTRTGHGGVLQIDGDGFATAAFDHHTSRHGDPNLHTHVVVANRVQDAQGTWRTLDARAIYAYGVAASERYQLEMESRLTRELGVTFEDVYTARGGQAVREIVGIDKGVREAFSSRTRDIGAHLDALVAEYTTTYGRAPSKATMRRLAQQATLATCPAKESGETLGEQREQWAGRARELLGRRSAVRKMTAGVVAGPRKPAPFTLTVDQVDGLARAVVEDLGQKRARWNSANVTATTERLLRDYLSPNADLKSRMEHFAGGSAAGTLADLEDLDATIREVVAATEHHSIDLSMPDLLNTPDVLRRRDRTVVFGPAHAKWRTSEAVLARETRLLEAAETAWGPVFDAANVDLLSR
ncbi:MobF family relaxase, partial [Demequina litorisediminis]|uniref:MobF family relaxase n=1 Tax=Demequina litorisediminis TaxID=1849022 RepID=UPI0024E114A0